MVAYGSKERPVDLGPFSRIVEVHWTPTMIAAVFSMKVDSVASDDLGDTGGPPFVEPFTLYSAISSTYSYTGASGAALADFRSYSGKSWHNITGPTVSGAPSLPGPYTFDKWQWNAIDAFGTRAPFLQFGAGPQTTDLEIPVPGHPSLKFNQALANNLILKAQGYAAGGPYQNPVIGQFQKWATADVTGTYPAFVPVFQDAETAPLSAAGITLSYKGKTYEAIGAKVAPPPLATMPGEFWVLFKRHKETVTA
jgi:hypothetical protein